MSSSTSDASTGPLLADYAPVPPSSVGPSLNHEGYYVGRGERNLFWVTARVVGWPGLLCGSGPMMTSPAIRYPGDSPGYRRTADRACTH
jgi:hypothetical protein